MDLVDKDLIDVGSKVYAKNSGLKINMFSTPSFILFVIDPKFHIL
jgi:hypothetical protein